MTDTIQPDLPDKATLMARIDESWLALERAVGRLSEAELTKPADANGWSVKDHLAHITVWEQSLLALLEGRDRSVAVGLPSEAATWEIDAINEQLYQLHRHESLDEVLTALRRSHQQVLGVVEGLTDEDLERPYSHYQPDATPPRVHPVVGWVIGDTYEHYEEHQRWIESLVEG